MSPLARRRLTLALTLLAIAAVALLGWRGYSTRQAAQRQAAAAASAVPVIELAASDLATAHPVELRTGLPVSGTLKAVLTEFEPPALPVQLLHREGDRTSARVRALVDHLAAGLREQLEMLSQSEPTASAAG